MPVWGLSGVAVCESLPVLESLQVQGLLLVQVLWEELCCSSRSCSQGTSGGLHWGSLGWG